MSVSEWLRYYPRKSCISSVQVLTEDQMPRALRGVISPREYSIMPEAEKNRYLSGEGVYPDPDNFEVG